jgi:hypothetical protein
MMKSSTQALLLFFWATLFSTTCFGGELTGTVRAKDGRTLAGISVYSFDDRGTIAPRQGRRFYEETDSRGRFRLANHGRAIYFQHRDFQPLTKIIDYSASRVDVVLEAEHDVWDVPNCAGSAEYQKNKDDYVEMQYPSIFLPRPREVHFKRVKDVDYVLYIFAYGPSERRNALQGWFGPYAADESVSAKSLVKSTTFNERWAKFGDLKALDIYGQTTDGKHWRYLSFGTSAIFYEDASQEAASIFDDMLGRSCHETRKL